MNEVEFQVFVQNSTWLLGTRGIRNVNTHVDKFDAYFTQASVFLWILFLFFSIYVWCVKVGSVLLKFKFRRRNIVLYILTWSSFWSRLCFYRVQQSNLLSNSFFWFQETWWFPVRGTRWRAFPDQYLTSKWDWRSRRSPSMTLDLINVLRRILWARWRVAFDFMVRLFFFDHLTWHFFSQIDAPNIAFTIALVW